MADETLIADIFGSDDEDDNENISTSKEKSTVGSKAIFDDEDDDGWNDSEDEKVIQNSLSKLQKSSTSKLTLLWYQ